MKIESEKTKQTFASPMFLQEGPHGTMVLYIPSVFISYNGEALDEKSVLLRSSSVISKVALEILHLIEPIEDGTYLLPFLNKVGLMIGSVWDLTLKYKN